MAHPSEVVSTIASRWGRGRDVEVSAGSRGGRGVARARRACWSVEVAKNAFGVQPWRAATGQARFGAEEVHYRAWPISFGRGEG